MLNEPYLPKMTERAWMAQLDALARMLGWAKWQDNATNVPRVCPHCRKEIKFKRNAPGWPDRVYVRGDTLVFVEGKADRGRLSDDQKGWLDALAQIKRVLVFVWRPRHAEEAAKVLR